MALPLTGAIDSYMIKVELGRDIELDFNIRLAATGIYAGINAHSNYTPSSDPPHAYTDWYGYNHTASPPPPPYPYQHSIYQIPSADCNEFDGALQTVYSNVTPLALNAVLSATSASYTSFTNNINYSYTPSDTRYRYVVRLISGLLRVDGVETCGPPQ